MTAGGDGRGRFRRGSARADRLPAAPDLSNLYANARNHGFAAGAFLERIPLESLAYVHVGGGIERDGLYHDTHAHRWCRACSTCSKPCARRVPPPPPGILLERDEDFRNEAELLAEVEWIAGAAERGARRRAGGG
jgi:uncharacterized protein (UPF0276 family)